MAVWKQHVQDQWAGAGDISFGFCLHLGCHSRGQVGQLHILSPRQCWFVKLLQIFHDTEYTSIAIYLLVLLRCRVLPQKYCFTEYINKLHNSCNLYFHIITCTFFQILKCSYFPCSYSLGIWTEVFNFRTIGRLFFAITTQQASWTLSVWSDKPYHFWLRDTWFLCVSAHSKYTWHFKGTH